MCIEQVLSVKQDILHFFDPKPNMLSFPPSPFCTEKHMGAELQVVEQKPLSYHRTRKEK